MGGNPKPGTAITAAFVGWKSEIVDWSEGWGVSFAPLARKQSGRGPSATSKQSHLDVMGITD